MAKKLYVGNLSFDTTEQGLQQAFEQFGTVISAQIITDRETGRSKGFGFVEVEDDAFDKALEMNGKDLDGRALTVNEARPKEDRPRTGGGYSQTGGGNFNRGGGRGNW